jgi:hypothetical protein
MSESGRRSLRGLVLRDSSVGPSERSLPYTEIRRDSTEVEINQEAENEPERLEPDIPPVEQVLPTPIKEEPEFEEQEKPTAAAVDGTTEDFPEPKSGEDIAKPAEEPKQEEEPPIAMLVDEPKEEAHAPHPVEEPEKLSDVAPAVEESKPEVESPVRVQQEPNKNEVASEIIPYTEQGASQTEESTPIADPATTAGAGLEKERNEDSCEEKLAKQKHELNKELTDVVKAARKEGMEQGRQEKVSGDQNMVLTLIKFLRLARHRRSVKINNPAHNDAIEKFLACLYSSDAVAMEACAKLHAGSKDRVEELNSVTCMDTPLF